MVERLHMGGDAAKHVQAYIEYERIVGNADGGKMMSEAEFEAYKNKVREARKNRLYVHWRNMETGADCKSVGPQSHCFCGHRYKDHNFDNVENKQVFCRSKLDKCKCKLFCYIPICKCIPNSWWPNSLCSWKLRSEMSLQAFMPGARSKHQEVQARWVQVRSVRFGA